MNISSYNLYEEIPQPIFEDMIKKLEEEIKKTEKQSWWETDEGKQRFVDIANENFSFHTDVAITKIIKEHKYEKRL